MLFIVSNSLHPFALSHIKKTLYLCSVFLVRQDKSKKQVQKFCRETSVFLWHSPREGTFLYSVYILQGFFRLCAPLPNVRLCRRY